MPERPNATDRGPVPGGGSPRVLDAWRREARSRLAAAGIESAAAEADLIARHVLGLTRVELVAGPRRPLGPNERRRLTRILHRRLNRFPLQYLLREVDFFGLTLEVTPAVLIPRPETEGLVERVLAGLAPDEPATVLDVGTGSGAIALAVAAGRPRARVWGTDLSPAALRVARRNARRLGLADRVRFFAGDLTDPVERAQPVPPFRVVVSNPPYVASRERRSLAPEVADHEPAAALFAPERGLGVIRRLIPRAARLLPEKGLLALEIGESQGEAVRKLAAGSRQFREVRVERDLAGRDRYLLAVRSRS